MGETERATTSYGCGPYVEWTEWGLNPRPKDFQSFALPAELSVPVGLKSLSLLPLWLLYAGLLNLALSIYYRLFVQLSTISRTFSYNQTRGKPRASS